MPDFSWYRPQSTIRFSEYIEIDYHITLETHLTGILKFSNYVSVNSKPDHPLRVTPGNSQVVTASGVGFSPIFLCPRGWGFELGKFPTVLKKMQELLDLFQRNQGQLEKQVFLCCFISIFAKTVDV